LSNERRKELNNWTDFDELGAMLIAVIIISGTIALYILSAIFPSEIIGPNELNGVAVVVMAAYGYKLKQNLGTRTDSTGVDNAAKN
jgi:hypothetical protein